MGIAFKSLQDICADANNTATIHGFWDRTPDSMEAAIQISKLGLICEEIGEAITCVRNGDKALVIELADICIRVFDFAGRYDLNLQQAIEDKMMVNKHRAHMHGGKRW